jgi:GT2 family glycosyltransferase
MAQRKERMLEVDWIAGACFMMPRTLFLELGGFDPRFFLFFEDTDLCRRVKQRGKKVVFASSVHALDRKERLSGGGVLELFTKRTARIHLASAVKYFWKWRKSPHTTVGR